MKLLKKLTTMMLGAALLCTLVMVPGIKSHADGPVTWYITYNGGSWYASNNTIDWWTGIDFVENNMKDGDHIVVNAGGVDAGILQYKVTKKVGDLVSTGNAFANIEAPYVDRAYVAGKGSVLIVNAPTVYNVEIWPDQTIQINGNVVNFLAHYAYDGTHPRFAVTGTVTAANVNYNGKVESSYNTIYSIPAGVFTSDSDGVVLLKDTQFSTVPGAAPATGTTTTTTTPATADPSKKQLDKVPQTGTFASKETIIFLMLAAVFGAAALATASVVKKRA